MQKLWFTLFLIMSMSGCAFPVDITTRSVVRITSMGGRMQGTGFVVDKIGDRYVVFTAAHVLAPGKCQIDGYDALVGIVDPVGDIAILTFKSFFPYKPLGFGSPRRGQHARLIGYPGRTFGALAQTDGHVMAVNRSFFVSEMWYDGGAVPGFSGGPIVDDWGRILGMAKSHVLGQYTSTSRPQWLCYDTALCCVPSRVLEGILRNLRRHGAQPTTRPGVK